MEKIFVSTVESLYYHCKGCHVSIYGAKTLAQRVYYYLELKGVPVDTFVVSCRYRNPLFLANGIPVVRIEEEKNNYDCMVLAVGRGFVQEVEEELLNYNIKKLVIINSMIQNNFPEIRIISNDSYISERACLEERVQILADNTSQIIIEDDVTIKAGVQILAIDHSYIHINRGTYIGDKCCIEVSDNSKVELSVNVQIGETGNFFINNHSKLEIMDRSHIVGDYNISGRDGAKIIIENDVYINRFVLLSATNGILKIGEKSIFGFATTMSVVESCIDIGKDNMFSHEVKVITGDHKIIDRSTKRDITNRKTIRTGSHVWTGIGAMLLPGCDIGEGSIVGAVTVVNKIIPKHSTCAGNTARVLRENIDWQR